MLCAKKDPNIQHCVSNAHGYACWSTPCVPNDIGDILYVPSVGFRSLSTFCLEAWIGKHERSPISSHFHLSEDTANAFSVFSMPVSSCNFIPSKQMKHTPGFKVLDQDCSLHSHVHRAMIPLLYCRILNTYMSTHPLQWQHLVLVIKNPWSEMASSFSTLSMYKTVSSGIKVTVVIRLTVSISCNPKIVYRPPINEMNHEALDALVKKCRNRFPSSLKWVDYY